MLTRIVAALMSIIMFGAAIIPMEANEETYLVVTAPSTDEMFKIDGTVDTQALLLKAEIQATKSSPNTGLMPLYLTNTFFSFGVLPDIKVESTTNEVESTTNEVENTNQETTIEATARPVFTGEKGKIIGLIDELCTAADFNNPALIKAIVHCESSFNQYSISSHGAEGLMQIIPKYFGKLMSEYGVTDLCADEIGNLRIGIHWMQYLITKYDGNLSKALVAYNCGESVVDVKGRTSNSYSKKVLNIVGDYM